MTATPSQQRAAPNALLTDALRTEAVAYADLLGSAGADTPVPSCGSWTLRQLTHHVGLVHRWATANVLAGGPESPRPQDPPPTDDDLVAWYRDGVAALVSSLADPDRPCWTFAGPATASWWLRRMAHETSMHRYDASLACGAVHPVDAELAADGIAEVLEVMHPRQVRLGRAAAPAARLDLLADAGGSWSLDGPEPAGRVGGPADALLLLLWRRTTLADPRLRVLAGRDRVEAVLAEPVTP